MTSRRLSVISAYLIALYAIDSLTQVSDILSLPLPRQVFGMSISMAIGTISLLLLWPTMRAKKIFPVEAGIFCFILIILFWSIKEIMIYVDTGMADLSLILSFVPALFLSLLVRIHLRLFSNHAILLKAFTECSITIVLIHSALLLLIVLGVTNSVVNSSEIVGRNGISFLLPLAIFLNCLSKLSSNCIHWFKENKRLPAAIALALIHMLLNQNRTGILLILLIFLVGWVGSKESNVLESKYFALIAIGTILVIISATSLSYPILEKLDGFKWLGVGDSELSTKFRSMANWEILSRIKNNPIQGLGWNQVHAIRSGGYISHTLFLIVFCSYGISGVLPVAIFAGVWIFSKCQSVRYIPALIVTFIAITTCFVNDPLIWYGMMLPLGDSMAMKISKQEG